MKNTKVPPFNFAQYMMLNALTGCCTTPENQVIINQIPAFALDIGEVRDITASITPLLGNGKRNITGGADNKYDLKIILAETLWQVTGPVSSFAAKTRNPILLKAVKHTRTSYRQMADELLVATATDMIALITPQLPKLVSFKITAASLTLIDKAATDFNEVMSEPRINIVQRSTKLRKIGELLYTGMNIIRNQCDPLVAGFETLNQRSFVAEYIKIRKLTPFGTLSTRVSVTVIMGDSNAPVKDATVHIDNTLLNGKTESNGKVTISRVPMGFQTLTVTAPGYPNPIQTAPIDFKKGKAAHITINMTDFLLPEAKKEVAKKTTESA